MNIIIDKRSILKINMLDEMGDFVGFFVKTLGFKIKYIELQKYQ